MQSLAELYEELGSALNQRNGRIIQNLARCCSRWSASGRKRRPRCEHRTDRRPRSARASVGRMHNLGLLALIGMTLLLVYGLVGWLWG
jgi:hypothetical protein